MPASTISMLRNPHLACIATGFRVRRKPAGYAEEDGSRFGHDNGMDLRFSYDYVKIHAGYRG